MFRLVAILGPTASGKSALAVAAARRLEGEIVNCDSMQLHKGMAVGTAKPSPEERRIVPHHLYDRIEPDEFFSAGLYAEEARPICRDIASRGRIPFLVGGTGLYFRAFTEGIFQGPSASQPLRRRLRQSSLRKGAGHLHRLLRRFDPESADRIAPNDELRLIRAIEVRLLSGQPISRLKSRRQPLQGFSILKIGIEMPRQTLYDRIDRRVGAMFSSGLVDEVERLLQAGFSSRSKGFEALGYRHAVAFLEGEIDLDQAMELTRRDSRRYAKRQLTWFRREKGMNWIDSPGEAPSALERFLKLFREPDAWTGAATA